jgi:hypothetical protein
MARTCAARIYGKMVIYGKMAKFEQTGADGRRPSNAARPSNPDGHLSNTDGRPLNTDGQPSNGDGGADDSVRSSARNNVAGPVVSPEADATPRSGAAPIERALAHAERELVKLDAAILASENALADLELEAHVTTGHAFITFRTESIRNRFLRLSREHQWDEYRRGWYGAVGAGNAVATVVNEGVERTRSGVATGLRHIRQSISPGNDPRASPGTHTAPGAASNVRQTPFSPPASPPPASPADQQSTSFVDSSHIDIEHIAIDSSHVAGSHHVESHVESPAESTTPPALLPSGGSPPALLPSESSESDGDELSTLESQPTLLTAPTDVGCSCAGATLDVGAPSARPPPAAGSGSMLPSMPEEAEATWTSPASSSPPSGATRSGGSHTAGHVRGSCLRGLRLPSRTTSLVAIHKVEPHLQPAPPPPSSSERASDGAEPPLSPSKWGARFAARNASRKASAVLDVLATFLVRRTSDDMMQFRSCELLMAATAEPAPEPSTIRALRPLRAAPPHAVPCRPMPSHAVPCRPCRRTPRRPGPVCAHAYTPTRRGVCRRL